jgi:hypothetical protein
MSHSSVRMDRSLDNIINNSKCEREDKIERKRSHSHKVERHYNDRRLDRAWRYRNERNTYGHYSQKITGRRSYEEKKDYRKDGIYLSSRIYISDLPKNVSNNDLRVNIFYLRKFSVSAAVSEDAVFTGIEWGIALELLL